MRHALPLDCTVRGSIVVVRPSGFSFDRLRLRIHPSAARVAELTERWPATLVLTDLLSRDTWDLRPCDLTARRSLLVSIAEDSDIPAASADLGQLATGTPAVVTPHTPFVSFAIRWLEDRDESGRDGVIARAIDGVRMVRVPRLRTATCVVTGIRREGSGPPHALRLGLFDGDALVDMGRTSSLRGSSERRGAALALAGLERDDTPAVNGWIEVRPEMACEVHVRSAARATVPIGGAVRAVAAGDGSATMHPAAARRDGPASAAARRRSRRDPPRRLRLAVSAPPSC